MKLLSIIIPVYNAEKYIGATLDCILCQPNSKYCEILLIDDGSTDNSYAILQSYEKSHSQIRVIKKENEGVSATRNLGIEIATGDYIYFMDADDLLHPEAISVIFNTIREENPDMVVFKHTTFYKHPKFKEIDKGWKGEIIANSDHRAFNFLVGAGCAVSLWNKVIRRSRESAEIRLDPKMTYGEDMFVSWKYTLLAEKIVYLPLSLYYYRQVGNSAINKFHPNLFERYSEAFDDLRRFSVDKGYLTGDLIRDFDFHFALRLPSLTLMESRAPYNDKMKRNRLSQILKDERIMRSLINDQRIPNTRFFLMAMKGNVKGMLKSKRREQLMSRILFPLKKALK